MLVTVFLQVNLYCNVPFPPVAFTDKPIVVSSTCGDNLSAANEVICIGLTISVKVQFPFS